MFRTSNKLLELPMALALLAAAACGGGGGNGDDTVREISNEELAQMVLELGQFGPEFATFAPDPEGGIQSLDSASADDFDAGGERADLEKAGFVSSYEANFEQQAAEGQPFFIGNEVGLFETSDGAASYMSDSQTEINEYVGRTFEQVTLESVTEFEVDVADDALGAEGVVNVRGDDGSSVSFWLAAVDFRRGRIIGHVGIFGIGLDDTEKQRLRGNAEALASVMNERIASVLGAETAAPAAAGQ